MWSSGEKEEELRRHSIKYEPLNEESLPLHFSNRHSDCVKEKL